MGARNFHVISCHLVVRRKIQIVQNEAVVEPDSLIECNPMVPLFDLLYQLAVPGAVPVENWEQDSIELGRQANCEA